MYVQCNLRFEAESWHKEYRIFNCTKVLPEFRILLKVRLQSASPVRHCDF